MTNYNLIQFSPLVILALASGIPILIFGIGAFVKFWQFMNQPVINGSIPIWALFAIGFSILIIFKRRQTNPYIV